MMFRHKDQELVYRLNEEISTLRIALKTQEHEYVQKFKRLVSGMEQLERRLGADESVLHLTEELTRLKKEGIL